MNTKKVVLFLVTAVLIPNTVECFGRRRNRKKTEVVPVEFLTANKTSDSVAIANYSAGSKGCASCSKCSSKLRSASSEQAACPMDSMKSGAPSIAIDKQQPQAQPASKKVESSAWAPVKEKELVSKPVKEPVKEPAKESAKEPSPEGELIELISQQEYDDFANNPAAVIEVYTNSCGVCKTVIPILKRLGAKYEGKILFAKVNGQSKAGDKIWKKEKIESVPKFYYYSNGKMVHKSSGGCKQDIMEIHLKKAFPTIAG